MQRVHWWALALLFFAPIGSTSAQARWTVQRTEDPVQVDGFLKEWSGPPQLVLRPGQEGLETHGSFKDADLEVSLQARTDKQFLYLALRWKDDIWDVHQVKRKDAVWVSSDRKRRNRMLFYDNIRFQIQGPDYDYTAWISPRVQGQGPFIWHRLLQRLGMETATSRPLVSARFREGQVTMEIRFRWKELRLKPKSRKPIPLAILVADADQPDEFLESKADKLKWLEWRGALWIEKGN